MANLSELFFSKPSRSRRASQDITRPDENIVPWQRSKSRSVDHGFSPPFDLDSLRNKVEGRFESVDRLSRESDGGGSKSELSEKKMGKIVPPMNTITYTVESSDTLTSVAARFDTTPSELTKLNRLTTRLIFPGQQLYVPDKSKKDGADGESKEDDEDATTPTAATVENISLESDILDNLRPVSPKPLPGYIERIKDPSSPKTSSATSSVDGDTDRIAERKACERFLKISVRHITDGQGVVEGVLLVTPNAVMFDPNVSDALVIEHGPESYGVIAPMEFVVNAAIYYDIAHMRVGHSSDTPKSETSKPEIYYAKSDSAGVYKSTDTLTDSVSAAQNSPGKDSLLVKDETFPELAPVHSSPEEDNELDDNESVCSCTGQNTLREGNAFPKAFERDLVTPTNLSNSDNEMSMSDKRSSRQFSDDSSSSFHQKPDSDLKTDHEKDELVELMHDLEKRRRSVLDQHWAKPKSIDQTTKDESENMAAVEKSEKAVESSEKLENRSLLVKLSCHDSGIDIREAGDGVTTQAPASLEPQEPEITPVEKKVFSDADIINAKPTEWVPPFTMADIANLSASLDSNSDSQRKKTSSVSFSLDSNQDGEGSGQEDSQKSEDAEKHETKKNKMLKRLSYPLAWMEGLTGDKDEKDGLSGLPNIDGQQHSSMFSKVFSSSPINLVSDIGTGLFLTKTPSEESNKSPIPGPPPPTPAPLSAGSDSESPLSSLSMLGGAGRSSVGTYIRQHAQSSESKSHTGKAPAPKLDYRSMVSVDDMPELFVSVDKLIPRPARSCQDPPLYLRLRMGKPINKKIPKSTPIMSYGKKKMRPEYWFSVPRNRVDDLYNFLILWVPHLYGDLEEMDPKARGYELVESDTELWEDEGGEHKGSDQSDEGDLGDLTRESWEVLSMSEELRRAIYASNLSSLDLEFVPDLIGVTEILTEDHRKQLSRHLPARAEGYMWTLVFSTSQHGFSLNSMYRKMCRFESPILLVIEDTEHNVFGALTSCALKVSDHFYGTGESLLFRFTPEFEVFQWTGDNMYFIKGNNESLAIGAGDGKFGLWLDGDLYQGRTQPCSTYGNKPLAPQEDFVVKTLECWAFV